VSSPTEPVQVADRLGVALLEPISLGDRSIHVGVSIGVATSERRPTSADQVLRDADADMYRVKQSRYARQGLAGQLSTS